MCLAQLLAMLLARGFCCCPTHPATTDRRRRGKYNKFSTEICSVTGAQGMTRG